MKPKLCFVILGIMGRTPVAGVAWQALHYLEGLRRLGHDVFYVEDTQAWPYNPETGSDDCGYILKYLDRLMTWCGLPDRWAFIDVSQGGRVYGFTEFQLSRIFEQAEVVINLTGSTCFTDRHLKVPVRVYLETDPGVPQIEVAQSKNFTTNLLSAHTHHFTFAENIGKSGCRLPVGPFKYHTTRQPIVLDWWQQPGDGEDLNDNQDVPGTSLFTTISNWKQSNTVFWNGETYTWSKDEQFLKFADLPSRSRERFELALACNDPNVILSLKSRHWRVVDA